MYMLAHVRQFIEKVKPYALKVNRTYGIPYGVVVAQAALETGWGRHVRGNNYFNIKGHGQSVPTHEYTNGHRVDTVDCFRVYNSMEESFMDYGRLLSTLPRYRRAFDFEDDPEKFAREIHRAGYATDPGYSDKLISIMHSYNLLEPPVQLVKDDTAAPAKAGSQKAEERGGESDDENNDDSDDDTYSPQEERLARLLTWILKWIGR